MIEMKNLSVKLTPKEITREDDNEKYLFSNEKTIGFRKDKKLYKFVGLRDGDDKQFELTFNSIKIDDSEKISANRIYFTSISDSGNITHNINDIEIINNINKTNFQNFVKVNEQFTNIEIVYELHLTNLTYESIDDIYNILDTDNNVIFTIDKPIAKDSKNNNLDIVEHTIYETDGKLFYKKYINDNIVTENYPIYVDINVTYDINNMLRYGILKSSNTIPSTDPRFVRWENALDGTDVINKIEDETFLEYSIPSSTDSCYVDRFFMLFDTSSIGLYDEVITAELKIDVDLYSERLVVHQGTVDDYNSIRWDTFIDDTLLNNVIIDQQDTYTFDVRNAINKSNHTLFVIRLYDLDFLRTTPSINTSTTVFNDANITLDIYYKPISSSKTFKFDLENNGTGVLSSNADNYIDCIEGSGVTVVHSDITSSYLESIMYDKITSPSGYTINRTYLCFDTRQLSPYLTDVVDNIQMKLVVSNNDIANITLLEGTQNGFAPLSAYNWNSRGRKITDITLNTPDDDLTITMNRNGVNFNDFTSFVLLSTEYDYQGQESDNSLNVATEIDFSQIYLEIEIQSHKVYGQTYKKIEYNTDFILNAYANTSSGIIKWFDDNELLNEIDSGNSITLNSKLLYDDGINFIYAILEDNSNNKISNNTLEIRLDIFNYDYDNIPSKNNNVIPMSLDTTYFKNYSCLNGVCFVYGRIIEEVYEENIYVSDGVGNGSYNLYTEYDSINEFYTNIYEVDIAIDYNLDITKIYNRLDNITLVNGSRILLFKQENINENGIYVVSNNGKISRTEELSSDEQKFRAKINIKAGTYLDVEFHTFD